MYNLMETNNLIWTIENDYSVWKIAEETLDTKRLLLLISRVFFTTKKILFLLRLIIRRIL